MIHPFIPVACPDISELEKRYVNEALNENWISSTGRFLDRFEREFSAFCSTRHAIACCNGTAALHIALLGLGIGPGDEVIVPSLTFVATANAVTYTGAKPIFVDSDAAYWNLDPALVEAAITPRTKAIIAVHLYGHPADMNALNAIGQRCGILVLEDAAEAHGAMVHGRPVGSLARAAIFSFYGNKIITTGEGGIVTTDDDALATRLRLLRGQGMDPNRRYWFPIIGFNFRMTNLAAAIGCAQLERAGELLRQRDRIAERFLHELAPHRESLGIRLVCNQSWASPVNWLFCILVPPAVRDRVISHLAAENIETRPFFPPMHILPPYVNPEFRQYRALPVSEQLAASGINLPTYAAMRDADIVRICAALVAVLQQA